LSEVLNEWDEECDLRCIDKINPDFHSVLTMKLIIYI
jgi:hypothetical protein